MGIETGTFREECENLVLKVAGCCSIMIMRTRTMPVKILVVDDEPLVHRLLQYHLERAGYQTIQANNGQEALELATREVPQLIVMDIMMSDMDGLSALRQLKKMEDTKSIPVIVITANPHHASQEESESCGAALFMTKPFSPAQLLAEIRRFVPTNPS